MVTLSFVLTMEHTEVFRHHLHGGIAIWISCMEIQAGIIYVQEFGLHVFGWMECDDFQHRRFWKLHNEDWEVEELCGVLPQLAKVSWCFCHIQWRDAEVFFAWSRKQIFNKSKNTCTNKFSMCFEQSAFHFCGSCNVCFGFGCWKHPLRDACVWTHFSSQGELGSK